MALKAYADADHAGFQDTQRNTMADMNMPANDVPAEQAPAIAPPTRTDDQILPSSKWVPIGKRLSRHPLRFRLSTFSSFGTPCVLTHQLGCTAVSWMSNGSTCTKIFSLDALDITPSIDNNPFVAPPSSDTGITHRSNIDYAERIWEEFVQSIQTFLTDRKNLATASRKKKKTAHLLIPNVRYVGKDGREIFGMPIPDALLTDAIKSAPYYSSYLEHVTEYQRYLNEEHDKADDKSLEPTASQPPKLTPTPTKSSKKDQGKKHKLVMESTDAPSLAKRSKAGKVTKKRMPKSSLQLVDEVVDEGVPEKEPAHNDEEANLQRALELSQKEQRERTQGPARPMVIREPDSGGIQPLPEVQGKGKEKSNEDVPVIKDGDQDEGQAGPNPGEQDEGQAGSNPDDAEESQPLPSHVVHAGPNLEHMDLETTDASTQQKLEQMDEEFTTTAYPNVQENLKLLTEDQVILEEPASSIGTLSSLQNLDKDLSFTDQFFVEKPQEEEPGKTNAEAEVQSMVSVLIHQDTSSVPPMTTSVIDLTKSQSDSPLSTLTTTTSTITTTTTPPPPPL
ncbi:retrovirus-related pol polyprotein from transposon TNT 1-94 [Tanacetum coccineum]